MGLGCRLARRISSDKTGDTVEDLGSGAGNDYFVAREQTEENGRFIGLDMTEKMIGESTRERKKKSDIKRYFFARRY